MAGARAADRGAGEDSAVEVAASVALAAAEDSPVVVEVVHGDNKRLL